MNADRLLFLALVGRHLVRHRARAVLTLLGVALGVAVAVAIQLANHSAFEAFERSVHDVAGDAKLSIQSPAGDLDEAVVTRLKPLSDVARIEPVVQGIAVLAGHPETAFRVLGVDLLSPMAFRGYGDAPPTGAPTSLEGLVLTTVAADRLKLHVGDPLKLWVGDRTVSLHVVALLPPQGNSRLVDPMVAFADVSVAQELLGRVGRLDRVDLVPLPGQGVDALTTLVKPLVGPGEEVVAPEESNKQAGRMLAAFRTNMRALSYVALIVGAYLIYNAVSVSVVQRRREVATLRALGATRGRIFALFAAEAVVLGLAGAAIGTVLGALMAGAAVKAVGTTVNALYVATPVTGVAWTWTAFATGVVLGVGLAVVAACGPALDAASTSPALAMRAGSWEARGRGRVGMWSAVGCVLLLGALGAARWPAIGDLPIGGYVAATLVLLGCSLLSPLAVVAVAVVLKPLLASFPIASLALRNFRRAVGRNGVAVAALMVGMAMTVGVATMVGSFRTTVADWIGQTLPADYYLNAMGAGGTRRGLVVDPRLIPQLGAIPGVDAVEGFRNQYVTYDGVSIRLGGGDAAVLSKHGMLVLDGPGDARALYTHMIGRDEVVASEPLVVKHGIKAGGTIWLPTPDGPHAFHVAGIFVDYSSDQGYVLMDRGTYQRLWHDPSVTDIALYAKPGVDPTSLRGQIQQVVGARAVEIQSNGELRGTVLGVFDDTFAITYALHAIAIAVSLLGVIGTLFALVLERQRELSIMRYVGLTRREVARLVVFESGLLGLAGALAGLVAGAMLAGLLIEVINKQSFGWSVHWHLPWPFIAGSVLSLLVAALLAGLYPAWLAANLPVAEGLRRE